MSIFKTNKIESETLVYTKSTLVSNFSGLSEYLPNHTYYIKIKYFVEQHRFNKSYSIYYEANDTIEGEFWGRSKKNKNPLTLENQPNFKDLNFKDLTQLKKIIKNAIVEDILIHIECASFYNHEALEIGVDITEEELVLELL